MTLDEAIDQEDEIVRDNELYSRVVREGKFSTEATRRLALKRAEQFDEIAAEHRQLAKWLRELKVYREETDALDKIKMNYDPGPLDKTDKLSFMNGARASLALVQELFWGLRGEEDDE